MTDTTDCARPTVQMFSQSHGSMLCARVDDRLIRYVSANAGNFLNGTARSFLGQPLKDVLPASALHRLNNVATYPEFQHRTVFLGTHASDIGHLDFCAGRSGDWLIIECEKPGAPQDAKTDFERFRFLNRHIQQLAHPGEILQRVADLIKHLSGYAQVVVTRSLPDGQAQVVTEARGNDGAQILGCNLPAAPEPMGPAAPMRIVLDAAQDQTPFIALDPEMEGPDISMAILAGISPARAGALAAAGMRGEAILPIAIGGLLWGHVVMRDPLPKCPDRGLQIVFGEFASVFSTRAHLLMMLESGGAAPQVARRSEALRGVDLTAPILLLEDNGLVAQEIADLLGDLGFSNTYIAESSEVAFAYLARTRPHAAVLDVHLGRGRTSESVAKALRQKGIPRVFVSGSEAQSGAASFLDGDTIIRKPVDGTRLGECVKALLQASKEASPVRAQRD